MIKKCICQQCNAEFIARNDSINKFCSKSCNAKYHNTLRRLTKPVKQLTKQCLVCSSLIKDNLKFCNHSCAAKYNNKLRPTGHPSRTSHNSQRGQNQNNILHSKVSWCKICGSIIKHKHRASCSDACLQKSFQLGGIKSASTQVRRSKDEIKLYDLCANYFNSVRHNEPLVDSWDADIIIDDIKTAILWNGPWHYTQMPHKNHSLLQVQTRDRIKFTKLTTAGWNVMIFEDRHYTPESAFQTIMEAGVGLEPTPNTGYEPGVAPCEPAIELFFGAI